MSGQNLGVLEFRAHEVVRFEVGSENLSKVVCNEYETGSTSTTGGSVGKLPSVGVESGTTGAELPLDMMKAAVARGRRIEGIVGSAVDLVKLETKLPDPRLLKGALVLASDDSGNDIWDEVEVIEET
jgi:hypothetical protein